MPIETTVWDGASHLKSKEDVAAYVEAAFEEGDASEVIHVLGIVARSEGMAQIARETGLSRESLYRALSREGNPEFATVFKVMRALGLTVSLRARNQPAADELSAAS